MEKRIEINVNWTFKEVVLNIEALKSQYKEFLSPFFNNKKVVEWRDKIYALRMEEWRRDRLWEYLNGDIELDVLQKLI